MNPRKNARLLPCCQEELVRRVLRGGDSEKWAYATVYQTFLERRDRLPVLGPPLQLAPTSQQSQG